MESTILVVEDEPSISEVVGLYLRRAGFDVRTCSNGDAALEELDSSLPDLVVLDLMLPGADGYQIARHLRERGDTPIIMLTARKSEADRIAGLEMGADDYVVKPFSPQELVSRVRAVLRRATSVDELDTDSEPLVFGDIVIDPLTRTATVRGEERTLTAKEFDLLLVFARNPRRVFNREQLLQSAWGTIDFIDPSTVTVHVRRVREKIETDPSDPKHLRTVWGVGYRFEP